jgi:acyl carrier protein
MQIIKEAIFDLNEELDYDHLRQVNGETPIFEGDDSLDSLSLVSLIVDIEARVEDAFQTEVVLASEKAMSMQNSPYRNVLTLTNFVLEEMAPSPPS